MPARALRLRAAPVRILRASRRRSAAGRLGLLSNRQPATPPLDEAGEFRTTREEHPMANRITPCLWFDGKAEEAMTFYTSIFKNSKIGQVMHYGEAGPGPKGSVLSVTFELDGQPFIALNGGPLFTFSPATSFFVKCQTQAEVDEYWEKLSAGGGTQQGGRLPHPYRGSLQSVPP